MKHSIVLHISYGVATKLGPEVMRFEGTEFQSSRSGDHTYILRPETAEAYFYGYRVTHEAKYREWGWEMVQVYCLE